MIVLGDARTNGREPHADVFARVAERAGRTFWLNPEPRLYWNYGDSVMAAYERHCTGAFECWTTKHLENFVNVIAGGAPVETSAAGGGPPRRLIGSQRWNTCARQSGVLAGKRAEMAPLETTRRRPLEPVR